MRILMLGNSLTARNGLPGTLAQMLGATVRAHTRGGARLAEQLNDQTALGAKTQVALQTGTWDYVVLQDMSTGPVRTPEAYLRAVEELGQRVREAGAKPVIYATWPLAPGSARLAKAHLTYDQMAESMPQVFARAAEVSGGLLADVCGAFLAAERPAELYDPDGVHPSVKGSLLAARVIARTIADDAKVNLGSVPTVVRS